MPELPEVETIRLQLDKVLRGLKITGIEVLKKKSFIGPPSSHGSGTSEGQGIVGKRVIGVKRRAKITLIELDGGMFLAIHLKMTGQLIYRETKFQRDKDTKKYCEQKDGPYAVCDLPNKYTRVIISLDNGGKPALTAARFAARRVRRGRLYFNDLRIFGWIRVIRDIREIGEEKLGPEAISESKFTLKYFSDILKKTKKPVKLLIMDQEKLAGLGNIYANEALFAAGILPTRPAGSLTETEIEKLRNSIIKVLNEAIKHKGSSDKDEAYRQITGEKGTHQNYLMVYGKKDQKCPNCSGKIKRISLGGRGTFFCPSCQA